MTNKQVLLAIAGVTLCLWLGAAVIYRMTVTSVSRQLSQYQARQETMFKDLQAELTPVQAGEKCTKLKAVISDVNGDMAVGDTEICGVGLRWSGAVYGPSLEQYIIEQQKEIEQLRRTGPK